jgi:hypothetical protein
LENRGPKLIVGRGIWNGIGNLETDYSKTYRRGKYECIMTYSNRYGDRERKNALENMPVQRRQHEK